MRSMLDNADFTAKVFGHPEQLSLILLHLLRNSFDAIQNEDLKWIRIHSSQKNQFWILKISDSGPGIQQQDTSQIMNPFYTTKQTGTGKGLGLSISQGIAESHFGKLYLDPSFPPTTFVLEIPLLTAKQKNSIFQESSFLRKKGA